MCITLRRMDRRIYPRVVRLSESMIDTLPYIVIDADHLQEWFRKVLAPYFPDKGLYLVGHPMNSAEGESKLFVEVKYIEPDVSIDDLSTRTVTEYNRGNYLHFYVHDVINAAVTAGELKGKRFYCLLEW